MEQQQDQPVSWSTGETITFVGSRAYVVDPNLKSLDLGDRAEIDKHLKDGTVTGNPVTDSYLRTDRANIGRVKAREQQPVNVRVKRKKGR